MYCIVWLVCVCVFLNVILTSFVITVCACTFVTCTLIKINQDQSIVYTAAQILPDTMKRELNWTAHDAYPLTAMFNVGYSTEKKTIFTGILGNYVFAHAQKQWHFVLPTRIQLSTADWLKFGWLDNVSGVILQCCHCVCTSLCTETVRGRLQLRFDCDSTTTIRLNIPVVVTIAWTTIRSWVTPWSRAPYHVGVSCE